MDFGPEYVDTGKYFITAVDGTLRVKKKDNGSLVVFNKAGAEPYLKPSSDTCIFNKRKTAQVNGSLDFYFSETSYCVDMALARDCVKWDIVYPSKRGFKGPQK